MKHEHGFHTNKSNKIISQYKIIANIGSLHISVSVVTRLRARCSKETWQLVRYEDYELE